MGSWKSLTPASELAHCVDDLGQILLRGADPNAEPFTLARVRDGRGGFVERSIAELGFLWTPTETVGGWALISGNGPTTAASVAKLWTRLAEDACAPLNLDPQFILTTIACEASAARPDADGFVKAPRTEKGYPRRVGEGDAGDFARDAEDWRTSHGAHSSHGLMQTLISTATAARPDLFKGMDPSQFRTVLWSPANSIACGAAYLAGFPPSVLADPLAVRIHYGAGSVRVPQSTPNRWGAVVFDDLVPMQWIAKWNDAAAIRFFAERRRELDAPATPVVAARAPDHTVAWAFATFALFSLSVAAAWGASQFTRQAAVRKPELA